MRENYKIHSTGLRVEDPDTFSDKVVKLIKKKVPEEDLDVYYYT